MQGLQASGLAVPPPDYAAYARKARLGLLSREVGELGTSKLWASKALSIIRAAPRMPDDLLTEALQFHFEQAEKLGFGFVLGEGRAFHMGDQVVSAVSPADVGKALTQLNKSSQALDKI